MFYKLRNKVPSVCLRNIYFSYIIFLLSVFSVLLYGIELHGNNSACMGDTTPIPDPSRGLSGSANLTVLVKFVIRFSMY